MPNYFGMLSAVSQYELGGFRPWSNWHLSDSETQQGLLTIRIGLDAKQLLAGDSFIRDNSPLSSPENETPFF
jgi:hypothetical protein